MGELPSRRDGSGVTVIRGTAYWPREPRAVAFGDPDLLSGSFVQLVREVDHLMAGLIALPTGSPPAQRSPGPLEPRGPGLRL